MKAALTAVSGVAVLAFACLPVSAQLVYEPFDYPTTASPTNLQNQLNPLSGEKWLGGGFGSGIDESVVPGSLAPISPTLSQPIAANSGQINGSGSNTAVERIPLPITSSGDLYYSFTLKVLDMTSTSGSANSTSGSFFAGYSLNDTPGSVSFAGARLQYRRYSSGNLTQYQLGIRQDVNSAVGTSTITWEPSGTFHSVNDTVFIVARYRFNPASLTDDVATLWVNPDASTFGAGTAPATGNIYSSTGCDLVNAPLGVPGTPSIASFFIRQNPITAKQTQIDDIRVDRSWGQVTAPVGTQWAGAAGGDWSNTANWAGGAVPDGAGSFVTLGSGSGGTVNVDSPRTVGSLTIKNTGAYTISGSALTFDAGAGGTAAINVLALTDGNGNIQPSTQVISSDVAMNSNLEANVGTSQTLTMSGVVSGASATLYKGGGGTLVLTGNNTFGGGVSVDYGTLEIASVAPLGTGSNLTLSQDAVLKADAPLSFDSSHTVTLNGPVTINTNGNDVGIASLATSGDPNTLTKAGTGTLTVPATLNVTALSVNGGKLATAPASPAGTALMTTSVSIATGSGASLDLANNSLVVNYPGTSPAETIRGYLLSGRNGGTWDGPGLVSASAAADTQHIASIGYAEASTLLSIGGTVTTSWNGQSVDATSLLLKYTLYGDTNLDGTVNADDYARVDRAVAKGGQTGWINGDFNYDGVIDSADYLLMDRAFALEGHPLSPDFLALRASEFGQGYVDTLLASVPEPSMLGILGLAGLAVRRRRR